MSIDVLVNSTDPVGENVGHFMFGREMTVEATSNTGQPMHATKYTRASMNCFARNDFLLGLRQAVFLPRETLV